MPEKPSSFQNQITLENLEQRIQFSNSVERPNIKTILLDGKRIGVFALKLDDATEEFYTIGFITLNEDFRRKGIGTFLYRKIALSLDKPLRSDIELSDSAEKLWQKFEREGLAKKVDIAPNGKSVYEWIM
jgi:Acetyltransferase (GNAT) family